VSHVRRKQSGKKREGIFKEIKDGFRVTLLERQCSLKMVQGSARMRAALWAIVAEDRATDDFVRGELD
jgi:hypothetical protein